LRFFVVQTRVAIERVRVRVNRARSGRVKWRDEFVVRCGW
jgi:hypothetical protein